MSVSKHWLLEQTQVLRKGEQFFPSLVTSVVLLLLQTPPPGDGSWMRECCLYIFNNNFLRFVCELNMITFSSLFANAAAFILHTSSHYKEFRVYPVKFSNIYYYTKSIFKYILVYHIKHVCVCVCGMNARYRVYV
jgi:hypothetical protein